MTSSVALLAFIAAVALLVVILSSRSWRRGQERLPELIARRGRMVREPPNLAGALARVMTELETAQRLLGEVCSIGLWSKSDDSSDNRRKRQGLRETDWAVSGALRALTDLRSHQPEVPAALTALEDELRVLAGMVEPLPGTVTDTMGENWSLDAEIGKASDKVSELLERTTRLAEDRVEG